MGGAPPAGPPTTPRVSAVEILTTDLGLLYELLMTTDRNLRYQQNLTDRQIAIVVLLSTSWPRIQQQTDRIQSVVDAIQAGEYQEVPIE